MQRRGAARLRLPARRLAADPPRQRCTCGVLPTPMVVVVVASVVVVAVRASSGIPTGCRDWRRTRASQRERPTSSAKTAPPAAWPPSTARPALPPPLQRQTRKQQHYDCHRDMANDEKSIPKMAAGHAAKPAGKRTNKMPRRMLQLLQSRRWTCCRGRITWAGLWPRGCWPQLGRRNHGQ